MPDSELYKEICKRWDSLGLTEGLSGCINEKVRELFESEAKELLKDRDDEEPQFPRIVKMPPHAFSLTEEDENK